MKTHLEIQSWKSGYCYCVNPFSTSGVWISNKRHMQIIRNSHKIRPTMCKQSSANYPALLILYSNWKHLYIYHKNVKVGINKFMQNFTVINAKLHYDLIKHVTISEQVQCIHLDNNLLGGCERHQHTLAHPHRQAGQQISRITTTQMPCCSMLQMQVSCSQSAGGRNWCVSHARRSVHIQMDDTRHTSSVLEYRE